MTANKNNKYFDLSSAIKICRKDKVTTMIPLSQNAVDLQDENVKVRLMAFYRMCKNNEEDFAVIIEYFKQRCRYFHDFKEINYYLRCMRCLFLEQIETGEDENEEISEIGFAYGNRGHYKINQDLIKKREIRLLSLEEREHNSKIVRTRRLVFVKQAQIREMMCMFLKNAQTQYNASIILWYISFSRDAVKYFTDFIPCLLSILRLKESEKMTRTTFFIISNLLRNDFFLSTMTCSEIVKETNITGYDDEELSETIKHVKMVLKDRIVKTSSFSNYLKELFSGRLERTPYHYSETFWSVNINQLQTHKIEIIRAIRKYLKTGNMQSKCVAANDLYRFITVCPDVAAIVEKFDLKSELFKLCDSSNDDLRFCALQCLSVCIFKEWH